MSCEFNELWKFIEVSAEVRYWEDAEVNSVEDCEGDLVPCRKGDLWCPIIRLQDGLIINWTVGTKAKIHYKVCDQGEYWLLDSTAKRSHKYNGLYVPGSFLCQNENGYGDYIIMDVDENGFIENWKIPKIEQEDWDGCAGINERMKVK